MASWHENHKRITPIFATSRTCRALRSAPAHAAPHTCARKSSAASIRLVSVRLNKHQTAIIVRNAHFVYLLKPRGGIIDAPRNIAGVRGAALCW